MGSKNNVSDPLASVKPVPAGYKVPPINLEATILTPSIGAPDCSCIVNFISVAFGLETINVLFVTTVLYVS